MEKDARRKEMRGKKRGDEEGVSRKREFIDICDRRREKIINRDKKDGKKKKKERK